jgi:hypothetical protein
MILPQQQLTPDPMNLRFISALLVLICDGLLDEQGKRDEARAMLAEIAALQEWTRVERLSGAGSSPAFLGRQDRAARDHQAR